MAVMSSKESASVRNERATVSAHHHHKQEFASSHFEAVTGRSAASFIVLFAVHFLLSFTSHPSHPTRYTLPSHCPPSLPLLLTRTLKKEP